jgi:PEP-CTERM motif
MSEREIAMRRKISVLVAIAALVIGASLFVGPPTSHAAVITSVVVNVGSTQWCNTTATVAQGCTTADALHKIWNLGPNGVTLNPSDRLFLSQTGGAFNFDTTDVKFTGIPTVLINGISFSDNTKVLDGLNGLLADPVTNAFNEAKAYSSLTATASGFEAFVGYFDNIHTDACLDAGTGAGGPEVSGNCRPDVDSLAFVSVAGLASPAINNVFTDVSGFPNHCAPGGTVATCWDAGVIEIHGLAAIPEPSTLFLLGTGLMGLAVWGRRHLKRNP